MPDSLLVSRQPRTNEEENVLLYVTAEKEHPASFSPLSVVPEMPAKVMDQTMTTVSLSMEDDEKDEEEQARTVLAAMPQSRFVWKDDCEPPSPIRKLTQQQGGAVVLNTRDSLLGEETDTDGEDDEEEEEEEDHGDTGMILHSEPDDADQEYNEQLTKLNFRLEMEEHAREAIRQPLLPDIPESSADCSRTPVLISPSRLDRSRSPEPQVTTVSTHKVSMLESMTVGFVDTICLPRKVCGSNNGTLPTSTSSAVLYENKLEQGFLQVLGCSSPPDEDEIAQLWDMDTTLQLSCSLPSESPRRLTYPVPEPPTGPHRPGPRERVQRLRKWRRERSLTVQNVPERTYSMDVLHSHADESSWNPSETDGDLTYDSDPEMSVSMRAKKSAQKATTTTGPSTPKRRTCTYRWMVRESMNQNWDLVWHTEKSSTPIRAWMERGTIVAGQMLEPALVFRHNSECTQLRFLNICRILPAAPGEIVRATILARPSCTLRLMTSTGEEFFLEAPSVSRRNEIVDTWKLCIARFATLAVLEDVDSIQREFFYAGVHSYVPDVQEVLDDLERDAKLDV